MENKLLKRSENMSLEYCCSVVRLGEILEIPGANTVAKTLVNGRTIVIGKDHHEGDVMIYCSNETQLNFDFLSVNNLFEHIENNYNRGEVREWIEQNTDATEDEVKEYLRKHRGYFDDKCRVRMKKLAGEISMGVLFEFETLVKWCPLLKDVNIEELVGLDFDTVNDVLFIKAYVPAIKEEPIRASRDKNRNKKLLKYNRMIPGQFSFHYDTQPFEKQITRFKPDDVVTISNKIHGTSYIIGNVLVNKPKWGGIYEKLFVYLPKFLQKTKQEYDIIYSSRSVIKNANITNRKVSGFSRGLNRCFDKYYELLASYIPKGITLYGEIFGYEEGSNTFIQKVGQGYDYGCKPGKNCLMIYRITQQTTFGKIEWNVKEVEEYTKDLKELIESDGYTEISERIHPIDIFYHGALKDLYPDIPVDENWHKNFLERIKNDKEHFGMEMNEPLCRNSVPREGIVIRIDDDPVNEAFKLKCLKFLGKEAKEMDKGVVTDSEIAERY